MLASLNQVYMYEAIDPNADIAFDVGIVLALIIGAFKLAYHVALVRFCRA